jgi:hypothetical protein
VEDVIAVEVTLTDGARRFFLTYGRIQDRVDPGPVCELVLRHAHRYALGGKAVATGRPAPILLRSPRLSARSCRFRCALSRCGCGGVEVYNAAMRFATLLSLSSMKPLSALEESVMAAV